MSRDATHTAQADEATEIRNEAIRAINKIAQERHALWQDYLATVRSYDAMTAERDALAKQVAELTGELNARKVDACEVSKRCGELRAALNEAIDKLDRGFSHANVATCLRAMLE